MTQLPVKPGIDGIPTGLIPTDPAAFVDWFKNSFLPRWAANADARNAIPTSSSVVITGDTNTPAGIGIGPNSVTNGELVMRSPLSVMGNPTGLEANVQDIPASADGQFLQRAGGALIWGAVVPTITTADSITGLGTVASPLELVGDSASPGNTKYYGTDGAGALGYHALSGGSTIATLTQAGGASQLYSIPASATTIEVICIGGGGGGGGGILLNNGTGAGGAGGGAGACAYGVFAAADLGASVTIAFSNTAGGVGGAGTTAVGAGHNGIAGSTVQFGNLLQAGGGSPGLSGTGPTAGFGSLTGNLWAGTNGGVGASGPGGQAGVARTTGVVTSPIAATGGGAGAGVTAGPAAAFGGLAGGGNTFGANGVVNLIGGASGTIGGGGGGNGPNGSGTIGGSGGGGGGSSVTTAVNGGNGGNGGNYGGGGGGGGSAFNTASHAGNGGNGAPAACIIIAY